MGLMMCPRCTQPFLMGSMWGSRMRCGWSGSKLEAKTLLNERFAAAGASDKPMYRVSDPDVVAFLISDWKVRLFRAMSWNHFHPGRTRPMYFEEG